MLNLAFSKVSPVVVEWNDPLKPGEFLNHIEHISYELRHSSQSLPFFIQGTMFFQSDVFFYQLKIVLRMVGKISADLCLFCDCF